MDLIAGKFATHWEQENVDRVTQTSVKKYNAEIHSQGTRDPASVIKLAKRSIDAGVYMIMIESEGITESVKTWRTRRSRAPWALKRSCLRPPTRRGFPGISRITVRKSIYSLTTARSFNWSACGRDFGELLIPGEGSSATSSPEQTGRFGVF